MKELNKGDIVRWHDTNSRRRKKGIVLEVLGVRWSNSHKIKVHWSNGEITDSPRWQIFSLDD